MMVKTISTLKRRTHKNCFRATSHQMLHTAQTAHPLLLRLECKRIQAHLLKHREKPIGTCGRQMLAQSDIVDEMKIGVKDIIGSLVIKHLDKKRYYAFHYYCVRIGRIADPTFRRKLGIEPHAALTPLCLLYTSDAADEMRTV